ncbi:MAG: hypothetical protein HY360_04120 [Verrucomicrobia bacterium]|nr:hypothetical protein [Verrucomicrobiota bacterium]
MQPVKVFDPEGKEAVCEDLKNGRYRFATGGKKGVWSLERTEDIPSFVRMETFPWTFALGDSRRWFEMDPAFLDHPSPPTGGSRQGDLAPKTAETGKVNVSNELFVAGKFGKAARWFNQFVQIPTPSADAAVAPQLEGTIEFWFCPLWSATDRDFAKATFHLGIFRWDPVSIIYRVEPNPGNSCVYHHAYIGFDVSKAGFTRARSYLEAGKWYHIACTWKVDGRNNSCDIFINGRKRSNSHYAIGLLPYASPSKLLPPGQFFAFGSGHSYGAMPDGEFFDELRVSRVIRYHEDFEPQKEPFQPDKDTVVLMHLDGNTDALFDGKPVEGKVTKGNKF